VTSLRAAVLTLSLLTWGCAVGPFAGKPELQDVPYSGPGYEDGGFTGDDERYWVALTAINVIDDPQAIPTRDHYTQLIVDGLNDVPGFVAIAVQARAGETGRLGWTQTAWTSEQALDEFVASDLHLQGMQEFGPYMSQFGRARFEADASDLPLAWDDVYTRVTWQ
jgi:hypothetical protein